MAYKAIIFDIDGTAVPLGALTASDRLKQAIRNAQNKLQVAAATGRSFGYAQPIFNDLGLIHPCIIMSGSAILDPVSQKVVWDKPMSFRQSLAALELAARYKADIWISMDPAHENQSLSQVEVTRPVYTIWATVTPSDAVHLCNAISNIPETVAYGAPSWIDGRVDVHITHEAATKEHAVRVLLNMLKLNSTAVIGVGDSDNDLPVFKAVGHRIAMTSGSAALKALADEIAPSLEEDGLAQIIEKYASLVPELSNIQNNQPNRSAGGSRQF